MITIKELKDKIGHLPDDTVLRFSGYIEQGRGGSWDSDCSLTFEINETEVQIEVNGDSGSATGGYE